jgi:predicted tellurium resistance membrane protein TerC
VGIVIAAVLVSVLLLRWIIRSLRKLLGRVPAFRTGAQT